MSDSSYTAGPSNRKQNRLLRRLRLVGQAGRLELADALGISNSRVCDLVLEMIERGQIVEEHAGAERRGRRRIPLRLNPDHGQFVGFDMEAKRVRLVVTDFAGQTVWRRHEAFKPARTRAALVRQLRRFVDQGLADIQARFGNVLGVGLAAPGVVDAARGVILHYDLAPAAEGLAIGRLVAERTGLPWVVEPNIPAMTLAEWVDGAGRGLHTFICMAVRSGVGAGLVVNGRLYSGSHGFAGETGYMPVASARRGGPWRTLQELVSETALGAGAEPGDRALTAAKARQAGELLGAQLAAIAAVLDPQAIVLAGELVRPDGALWPHIEQTFRQTVLPELADRVALAPAELGPFAAAAGAAHRCFQKVFPVEPVRA